MTTIEQRGKAIETKYFRDEEMSFKAVSRRRKLLGLWAADYMNLGDEDALEYALNIVRFGVDNTQDGAVINKIIEDIHDNGLEMSEETIRQKMYELHRQAIIEIELENQDK